MFRKLSLVAVAAASLGAAALAPTSASAWGGGIIMVAGTMAGAGVVPASWSAARPITPAAMAAATCGDWSGPPGARAGVW